MPPSTGQLTILLIIITLAESGALGDLLKAPGWPRNRFLHAALGFMKFTERIINYNSLIINNSGRGVNFTRARRCEKKLSGCHKADISTPGECRGRGPSAASYREAMTQMTMGGAGARLSRAELRRWQPES